MKVFRIFLPAVAIAAILSTGIWTAQVQAQGAGGTSALMLAMREDVQKEINLVEDQVEELNVLRDEFRDAMREEMQELRNGGGGMEEMREKMGEMSGEFMEKAKEIFLEEQLERLNQIAFQASMSRDPGRTLKSRFDLSDEQVEDFEAARKENQEQAQKEIAEIIRKYQDKALSVLPEDMQSDIKEARGETFAQARNLGGQRGRGGQRGGGQRGQRGGGQRGQRGGDGGRPRSDF